MNRDYLKDHANVARIQRHQVESAEKKIGEIGLKIKELEETQIAHKKALDEMDEDLDWALMDLGILLKQSNISYEELSIEEIEQNYKKIMLDLDNIKEEDEQIRLVEAVDSIYFNATWEGYLDSIKQYARRHDIDLKEDPFKNLMSETQLIGLHKRIKEDFTYKNAQCDEYDYLIAGTCGLIGGLIDIIFVGAPGSSQLGNFTDEMANKATEKFAQLLGWNREKPLNKGRDVTKSAIGFLERKFKINYDQAKTSDTGGLVRHLSTKNHHLKSLGHSPDIVGLFFSILNQFTNTSTFLSNGEIITIETENFELKGGNFVAKVFCGFVNWFGHLASDWVGSSGAEGRGSGISMPFYNLFQLCDFGEFGKHRQTFAQITTKVFEEGYDFRHGIAMAIPVAVNEVLIRFMYVVKARFYHKRDWKACMPSADNPEVRRMLLVGRGVFGLVDGADALIRSGGGANIVMLLSRLNLINWVLFAHSALKELKCWWKEGEMDIEAVDKYLDAEFAAMLSKASR